MIKIGEKKKNVQYKKRVSVYAIVEREKDDKVAIVTDSTDIYFLIGGGIEKEDESIEKALRREIIEETGYSIKNVELFDQINSWCYSDKYGYIDVEATIYIAKFNTKVAEPIEKEHKLMWVDPNGYKDKLFHEYQRYILEKYANKKKGISYE